MSRLGKKPIEIPKGVKVMIDGGFINVEGPKGKLKKEYKEGVINIKEKDGFIFIKPIKENKESSALWGTYASHVKNMMEGVLNGFSKELIIEGVGYRASLEGENLVLNLGFSHPVRIEAGDGISFKVEKNSVTVSGRDKEKVGEYAAKIRSARKPEPYKGKGIRYKDEVIRRKAGKKTATTSA